MATKVLGIEIGERLIKVCESNVGPGARKVGGCIVFQTPMNAVSDGEIRDPDAVAAALRENLGRSGLKNKKVIFTISSARIAIREVTLPPVKETKLKAIVEANAADYFPVDMSKYHITYTLQDRITTGEEAGNRLLVMAAPMIILEGYFSLAALMDFTVQAIDYSGNSQFRLLEFIHTEGVTMYVDINGTYSITTVMKKNKLLMQRTFPSGVDDYVLAYMSGAGREESDYLETLRELGTAFLQTEENRYARMEETDEYLARLVGNMSRMADYYNSSNWDTPIDRLVLTGTGATVPGLKEAIAEATGLTVSIMTRVDKVSAPGTMADILPQFIACLGCAIAPVDFIPEKFSKTKKKEAKSSKDSLSMGVTVLVAGIAAAAALSASAFFGYMTALEEKQNLENKIADVAFAETVYNNALSYNKYKDDVTVLENFIESPNDQLRQFIDELEKKMPAEVNILSASCTKESVNINITVSSKTAAAKTVQQLRSFESIRDIAVGQLTEIVDESGNTTVAFSVECSYDYVPYELPKQTVRVPAADAADQDASAGQG